MSAQRNIILIGPPATGKSAVGEQLARALRRPFYDTDALVEQARGKTISEIFASEGEERFRRDETATLEGLRQTHRTAMVLATGGGVVLAERNRELLRQLGVVVYLRVGIEEQARRAARDDKRPLLATSGASDDADNASSAPRHAAAENIVRYDASRDARRDDDSASHDATNDGDHSALRDALQRLNAARAPLYEEIADLTIDTDDDAIADIARRIATSPIVTPAA